MVLTDAQGRLLVRRETGGKLRKHFDAVLFSQGFSYAEEHVGTNGVGTALDEGRRRLRVRARALQRAHPALRLRRGADPQPPHRPDRGLLDLSCLAEDANPMMRAVVQQAAADIERQLLEGGSRRERTMLEEFLAACRGGKNAVLAISGDMVMADARATSLLAPSDQAILRAKAEELRSVPSETRVEMSLSDGRWAQVHCRPVHVGGDVAGTVMNIAVSRPAPRTAPRRLPAATLNGLVGSAPLWTTACTHAREAARRRSTLVLVGEEGTGKLGLARALHEERWPASRFTVIDCADDSGWDEQLRAAFEGPESTVVLRHLDRLDPASAVELDGWLERLAQAQAFDNWRDDAPPGVWVIATLNVGLDDTGCPDKLLRHFAVSVTLPGLRHRMGDLHLLVPHLLERLAPRRPVACPPETMRVLIGYSWPGNVRQLEAALRVRSDAPARR